MNKKKFAASTASLLVAMPALAQDRAPDATLETVVVTGSKSGDFGQRSGIAIEQMPQSIQLLEDDELIKRGARSIGDALRAVPSAHVAGSRESRYQGFSLRIRGLTANQMRNGMRQRYYEDVDPSALSNIARIEVLKGPSGVLYGQSATGGLVSIITKQPTETFEGAVALTGGSFDQKVATVDLGGPISESLGIRLTGEIERSGTFVDHQDMDRENVGLTLAWRPSASVSGHLVVEHVRRSTANNPGLPVVGTIASNGVATVKRSTFLGEPSFSLLEADAPLIQTWVDFKLGDMWTLTPRLQYSEFNNVGEQAILGEPVAGQPTVIQRSGRHTDEKDKFYIGQIDLAGHATAFGLDHKLLFGIEYSHERLSFQQFGTIPCGIGPIDALNPVYGCGLPTGAFGFMAGSKVKGLAAYAQDQMTLSEAWNVVAGLRHSRFDYETRFDTAFGSTPDAAKISNTTWQLGTTYSLGGGLSLFGGYNTGFDLEPVIGARTRTGSPFEPETSDQVEAGVRMWRSTLRASLSAFRIRRNNVAVADPVDPGFQIQEGQVRVQGVELEGEWTPLPGWWLQGGYAYLDGRVTRTSNAALQGARLAETPEHAATASTRVTFGAVELRAGAHYVGSRKLVNGGAVTLPHYLIFDLGVGAAFGALRLDAALTNVGNKTYYYSDNGSVFSIGGENFVYAGTPRTFSLRVAYSFGGTPR
jgi:iron complex outermembrane recepter protein